MPNHRSKKVTGHTDTEMDTGIDTELDNFQFLLVQIQFEEFSCFIHLVNLYEFDE